MCGGYIQNWLLIRTVRKTPIKMFLPLMTTKPVITGSRRIPIVARVHGNRVLKT
jgi:hypothetical protein